MSGNILILGATSGIARALAEGFAGQGFDLALAARKGETLDNQIKDLQVRFGVKARAYSFDALDFASHRSFVEGVIADLGDLEGCVLAFGFMGVEEESWHDEAATRRVLDSNFTGAVTTLLPLAEHFEKRGHGFITTITSVAGDRGRKTNMTYGSAKAGLTVYMQGLLQRFAKTKVRVTVVKPGFVDTRMTFPLGKLPLIVPPEKAAQDILKAIKKGKPLCYTPWMWRWIMCMICHVPTFIFKKMKF